MSMNECLGTFVWEIFSICSDGLPAAALLLLLALMFCCSPEMLQKYFYNKLRASVDDDVPSWISKGMLYSILDLDIVSTHAITIQSYLWGLWLLPMNFVLLWREAIALTLYCHATLFVLYLSHILSSSTYFYDLEHTIRQQWDSAGWIPLLPEWWFHWLKCLAVNLKVIVHVIHRNLHKHNYITSKTIA